MLTHIEKSNYRMQKFWTNIKKNLKKLCEEYNDIFSKDSSDIGKTPLITMEIETGDSPPVCKRPYNLPFETHRLGTKGTGYTGKSWCNY